MQSSLPIGEMQQGRLLEFGGKEGRALLVGTFRANKGKPECEEHLQELAALCFTYGLEVDSKYPLLLAKIEVGTFLSKGKLEEVVQLCKERGIDIIVFDDDLSPNQQRNLEKTFERAVIDRTELILGVFAKRARTREAKVQVAIAQLKYQLPRLVRLWTHLERQRTGGSTSGGGYLKGAGEKQLEIDKRIVKKELSKLQDELEKIKKQRETQRKQRKRRQIPTFAIIGYTNSGKSTLLNALTASNVLVENKLFATLDTTTRRVVLPNRQEALLIDTVGFIRKIPHMLVASFKSTLEESLEADILLHIIDVSNAKADEQAETTYAVLKELNAASYPIITCLNKVDLCKDRALVSRIRLKYPNSVEISALKKEGLERLAEKMMQEIARLRKVYRLKVPQSQYQLVSELIKNGRVISLDYEDNSILLEIEISYQYENRLLPFLY